MWGQYYRKLRIGTKGSRTSGVSMPVFCAQLCGIVRSCAWIRRVLNRPTEANLSFPVRRTDSMAGDAPGLLVAGRGKILFQGEDVDTAAVVAGYDAVVVGECAATCWRIAVECGDALAAVEVPHFQRFVERRGNRPLSVALVDGGLNVFRPGVARLEAALVQPHFEFAGLQVALQVLGQVAAVAVRVRNEEARRHWPLDYVLPGAFRRATSSRHRTTREVQPVW